MTLDSNLRLDNNIWKHSRVSRQVCVASNRSTGILDLDSRLRSVLANDWTLGQASTHVNTFLFWVSWRIKLRIAASEYEASWQQIPLALRAHPPEPDPQKKKIVVQETWLKKSCVNYEATPHMPLPHCPEFATWNHNRRFHSIKTFPSAVLPNPDPNIQETPVENHRVPTS